jgi:hypothetical protein
MILAVAALALSFLGSDCDDEKSKSSEPPTPEKIAGMTAGAMKYCVVSALANPKMDVDFEWDGQHASIHMEKGEKGFCAYDTLNSSVINPRLFILTPPEEAKATEVGVYFLEKDKDNPKADDLTYQKFAPIKNGRYALIVEPNNGIPLVKVRVMLDI